MLEYVVSRDVAKSLNVVVEDHQPPLLTESRAVSQYPGLCLPVSATRNDSV